MILWGSQSGNSERLAKSLARLLQGSLDLAVTVDDLDNYDYENLATAPSERFIGLILSTYGEGDPPDNAVSFDAYLSSLRQQDITSLRNLQYFVFGLGSSKYQHFNRFATLCDESLRSAGGKRIGDVGCKDEVLRSDDSWIMWSADLIQCLSVQYGRQIAIPDTSAPELEISISQTLDAVVEPFTVPAEKRGSALKGRSSWFTAPIVQTEVLCKTESDHQGESDRTYLHLEFDVSSVAPSIAYEVGDHLAIWPENTDLEIAKIARAFGWNNSQLSTPIQIAAVGEATASDLSHPSPTTRETLLRHHLDICGPLTRESVRLLTFFAPNEKAKGFLAGLSKDDQTWETAVLAEHTTLGQIMEQAVGADSTTQWPEVLFAHLVQSFPRLQPRYFSIASAPKVHGSRLAITVGVVSMPLKKRTFLGLLSTQILDVLGGCATETSSTLPMHIRPSSFKLPEKSEVPIIMVAAGSGIAPFRAFALERHRLSQLGYNVGASLLFYGCHEKDKDFLYENEWEYLSRGTQLEVDIAESRVTGAKVYVQDRVRRRMSEVRALLMDNSAVIYICGSVKMSMGVKEALLNGFVQMGMTMDQGQEFLGQLKKEKRLQEDVWA